eukprot:TRINITY_DN28326_c0_g1_i1.p1 TRINITY_DN28326_c0_g1~~TRINITY_DN28326_c0_g1_i1.p1  ORF type:complete len:166 (-),score=52.01 TRINITY_DN28326_c0_g1_i1:5-502(-)
MQQEEFVFFWKPGEKNGHFSQWYKSPFVVDGVKYGCAEQYMMAKKAELFGDQEMRKRLMREEDPAVMKKLGRRVKNFDEQVWEKNCEEIVRAASYAKFSQNDKLKAHLMNTGSKILAEASPKDTVWGIGMEASHPDARVKAKWKGTNKLGEALMYARGRIAEETK